MKVNERLRTCSTFKESREIQNLNSTSDSKLNNFTIKDTLGQLVTSEKSEDK